MKIMVLLVLFFFGSTIQAQKTFELRYLGNMGVAMIHQDSVIIIDGEKNKNVFGGSYYWVMDLSGSLWERVVTIGDEAKEF